MARTHNPAALVRGGLIIDVIIFVQGLVDYELGGLTTGLSSLPHLILFDELEVGCGWTSKQFVFLGLIALTSIAI